MNIRGETFRKIREMNGKSQKKLADMLGCTRNYISLIENNYKKPSKEFIERWKQAVYS